MMDSQDSDYFDFTTEEEAPARHSSPMRPCPFCSKPIPADSLFCLYCGEPVTPARKNRWVVWVIVIILVAFIIWVINL